MHVFQARAVLLGTLSIKGIMSRLQVSFQGPCSANLTSNEASQCRCLCQVAGGLTMERSASQRVVLVRKIDRHRRNLGKQLEAPSP